MRSRTTSLASAIALSGGVSAGAAAGAARPWARRRPAPSRPAPLVRHPRSSSSAAGVSTSAGEQRWLHSIG